jgi:hypothetical protein
MKKTIIFLLLANLFFAYQLFAQESPAVSNLQFKGWGFVRNEIKANADYNDTSSDKINFNQMRLNTTFTADLAENYGTVVISPQFSKILGGNEYVAASGNTTTSQQTSGTMYDSRFDMHEAYFSLNPNQSKDYTLIIGRQELAYGEHLIIGSVPWHRIGRSFDGLKAKFSISEKTNIDLFLTKLQETNATSSGTGDTNFHGIYVSNKLGNYFEHVDIYTLLKQQLVGDTYQNMNVFGTRIKSNIGDSSFDYRLESLVQKSRVVNNSKKNEEYLFDVELGKKFNFYDSRLSLEYFDSTEHYDELFPTAHKWLGFADQFSRRNIKGYAAHFMINPFEKWMFQLDHHIFQRHSTSDASYNFQSTSLGTVGSNKNIANEWDLTAIYSLTKSLQLSAGYALVTPDDYIKDQNAANTEKTHWSYLQLWAKF